MINSVSSSSSALYAQWLQQQQQSQQSSDASSIFSLLNNAASSGAAGGAATGSSSGTGSLQMPSDLLAMLQSVGNDSASSATPDATATNGTQQPQAMPHHRHHPVEQAQNQQTGAAANSNNTAGAMPGNTNEDASLDSLLTSALTV